MSIPHYLENWPNYQKSGSIDRQSRNRLDADIPQSPRSILESAVLTAMGSRLPPIPRDQLPPEKQSYHDEFLTTSERTFGDNGTKFKYLDQDGAFIGPYVLFLETPEVGKDFINTVMNIGKLPLPRDARETAILACGGHFKAGYELYAHQNIAVKDGLLSEQQTEVLKKGEKPGDLNEACSIAYDVTKYLCSTPGPLPQSYWDKCINAFGKQGTVGLIHYAGLYAYTCIMLNACDAPVPE